MALKSILYRFYVKIKFTFLDSLYFSYFSFNKDLILPLITKYDINFSVDRDFIFYFKKKNFDIIYNFLENLFKEKIIRKDSNCKISYYNSEKKHILQIIIDNKYLSYINKISNNIINISSRKDNKIIIQILFSKLPVAEEKFLKYKYLSNQTLARKENKIYNVILIKYKKNINNLIRLLNNNLISVNITIYDDISDFNSNFSKKDYIHNSNNMVIIVNINKYFMNDISILKEFCFNHSNFTKIANISQKTQLTNNIRQLIKYNFNQVIFDNLNRDILFRTISKYLIYPYNPFAKKDFYQINKILHNKKMLLIDSLKINYLLISDIFSNFDFKIIFYNNLKKSYNFIINNYDEIDIILLNLNSFYIDGKEFSENIRIYEINNRLKKHIPIIIFTSEESDVKIKEIFNFNVNDFLKKDDNKLHILQIVTFWIYSKYLKSSFVFFAKLFKFYDLNIYDKSKLNINLKKTYQSYHYLPYFDNNFFTSLSSKDRIDIKKEFIKESKNIISDIKKHIENNIILDNIFIGSNIHKLKSIAVSCGLIKLNSYIDYIIIFIKVNNLPNDNKWFIDLEKYTNNTIKYFNDLIKNNHDF